MWFWIKFRGVGGEERINQLEISYVTKWCDLRVSLQNVVCNNTLAL